MMHRFLLTVVFGIAILPQVPHAQIAFQKSADSLFRNAEYAASVDQYKLAQKVLRKSQDWHNYLHCYANMGRAMCYTNQVTASHDTLTKILNFYETTLSQKPNPPLEQYYFVKLSYSNTAAILGNAQLCKTILDDLFPKVMADFPNNAYLQGRVRLGLAYTYYSFNFYVTAQEHAVEGIRALESIRDKDWSAIASSYLTLGRINVKLSDFQGAIETFQQYEKIRPRETGKLAIRNDIVLYTEYGGVYQALGNYTRALDYYNRMLTLSEKFYGSKERNTIEARMNIGDVYRRRQECDLALEYYTTALRHLDSAYTMPRLHRAMILSNMAECKSYQGRWLEAIQYWQRSVEEAEKLEAKAFVPNARESMARFYLKNNNPAEALVQLEAAEVLLAQNDKNRYIDLCRVRALIGRALNMQGKYREALAKAQQSLILQCKQGTALAGYDNPTEDHLLLSENAIFTLSVKADALYGLWSTDGGSLSLLTDALRTSQFAIQVGEKFRYTYQRNYDENYTWTRQYKDIFARGVAAAYQLFQQTKDRAYVQQAFLLADRNKAILLTEGLQNNEAKEFAGVPRSLIQREAQLMREITYYERLTSLVSAEKKAAEIKLFERRRDFEQLVAQMEREYPYYFEQKYRPRLTTTRDIQSMLEEKGLFIEYLVDESNRQMYIFTVSKREGLNMVAEPLAEVAKAQISNFNNLLQSLYLVRPDKRQQFIQLSHRLYQNYIAPIAKQLVGKDELVIVADDMLNYLPFELLVSQPNDEPFTALPYLFRQASVSYQYSSGLFVWQRNRQMTKPEGGIYAFAPSFEDNTSQMRGDQRFGRLPFAKPECQNIAKLFGTGQVTTSFDGEASEALLKASLSKPYRIIHIASHSFSDLKNPRFSGIVCTQPLSGTASSEDGILYAGEIYGQTIGADLVVLSSCDGGMGLLSDGEGLLGLNRSFIQAGASNIIYSLWSAKDQSTSNFMLEFYREINNGATYAKALRAAKLKMLANETTAVPTFWGGFMLIGY
jgi:CHAT domain-containing protein/Tfp pilus assembly protein PilE